MVTLSYGARGEAVRTLQSSLNAKGASINVDGRFGPATSRAVRSFQSAQGLAVDGVVGRATWAALGSAPAPAPAKSSASTPAPAPSASGNPLLRRGSQGGAVVSLQNALRARGASFNATGYFGSLTEASVRSFQSSKGLSVDGVVGRATWAALATNGGDASGSAAKPAPSNAGGESGGTTAPAPSSSRGFDGASIVSAAKSQTGVPYVWGASRPGSGFDCSGLTSYVYKQAGISIPRTARQQVFAGTIIPESQAVPGDLVAFSGGNWGHIGIYAGNGMIIDAGSSAGRVVYRQIWNAPHVFVSYR